jgi:hypothetical protein
LTIYVIENLGVGVPTQSFYYRSMQTWRDSLRCQLVFMLWNPEEAQNQSIALRLKRFASGMQSMERAFRQGFQAQQRRLALALNAKLNQDAVREYAKVLQELAKDGPALMKEKLKDPQPLTRWAAAMIAGRKRLHLEAELIERLSDPSPQVREAARQALIRLSRGNDFGPLPNATAKQIAQSVQAWRQWLALQNPPERLPEYLAYPQPEETERPPHRLAERLPPPHAAEVSDALE